MYFELLTITFIICFIIDYSGIIEEMEELFKKWFNNPFFHIPKPFSCSLCMTHWVGLLFIVCIGECTILNYGYVVLLSYLSSSITNFLYLLDNKIKKLIEELDNYFN